MESFSIYTGRTALLNRENVDTDAIIPKQFLARVQKSGYGPFLFFDWKNAPGTVCEIDDEAGDFVFRKQVLNPDFELNHDTFAGATILVTKNNFGCGSSREHAPWALLGAGFRVVIAPRKDDVPAFADIFRNNSIQNGLMLVELASAEVNAIFDRVNANPGLEITVDLPKQTVSLVGGPTFRFQINSGAKQRLLTGRDEIGDTLVMAEKIATYESKVPAWCSL